MKAACIRSAILALAVAPVLMIGGGVIGSGGSPVLAACKCGPPPSRGGGPSTNWTPRSAGPGPVRPPMGPIRPPGIDPGTRAAQNAAANAAQAANRQDTPPPEDEGELPETDTAGTEEGELPETDTAGTEEGELPETTTGGTEEGELPETETAGTEEGEPPETTTGGTEEGELPADDGPPAGPVVTTEVDADGNLVTVVTMPDGTVIRETTTTVTTDDFTSTQVSQTTTHADGSETSNAITRRTNTDDGLTVVKRTEVDSAGNATSEWVFSDDDHSSTPVDNSNDLWWANFHDWGASIARGTRNTAVAVGTLIALSPAVAASAVAGTTIFGVSVGGTALSGVATMGVVSGGIGLTQAAADTYMENANASWSEIAGNALRSGVVSAVTGAASATAIASRAVGRTAEAVGELAALGSVSAPSGLAGRALGGLSRVVGYVADTIAGSDTLTGIATNAIATAANMWFGADTSSSAPAPAAPAPVPRS
jgi:hypothetical protein